MQYETPKNEFKEWLVLLEFLRGSSASKSVDIASTHSSNLENLHGYRQTH